MRWAIKPLNLNQFVGLRTKSKTRFQQGFNMVLENVIKISKTDGHITDGVSVD